MELFSDVLQRGDKRVDRIALQRGVALRDRAQQFDRLAELADQVIEPLGNTFLFTHCTPFPKDADVWPTWSAPATAWRSERPNSTEELLSLSRAPGPGCRHDIAGRYNRRRT